MAPFNNESSTTLIYDFPMYFFFISLNSALSYTNFMFTIIIQKEKVR